MAHPSGLQFSSSQAVICVCRWPRPCGGMPILMRMGKRRSAVVINSRGLPGISTFLICAPETATAVSRCPGRRAHGIACRRRVYARKNWVVEHCQSGCSGARRRLAVLRPGVFRPRPLPETISRFRSAGERLGATRVGDGSARTANPFGGLRLRLPKWPTSWVGAPTSSCPLRSRST